MIKKLRPKVFPFFFILCACLFFFSCGSVKQIQYFQDLPDTTKIANLKIPGYTPPVINEGDILSISILTIDAANSSNVNLANAGAPTQSGVNQSDLSGYPVDKEGYIEMLELGKIKVKGLTIEQAHDAILQKALLYFKDPIVTIKNKNIKITLLGDISRPGTYNITTEKVTIIDVLGLAGDLTNYGRRDNVLLLRQNGDNTLSSIRLNLKSSDVLKSPYYYMQNNDVLYIEPTKSKGIASDQEFSRNLQVMSLVFSTLITLYSIFRFR